MEEPTIKCPSCGTAIKLTESLAGPLIENTRRDFEEKLRSKDKDIQQKLLALKKEQDEVVAARNDLDAEILKAVATEKEKIAIEEKEKAKKLAAMDLKRAEDEKQSLEEILKEREAQLQKAHTKELELTRKQRAFDEEKRQMELTIEKRVSEQSEALRVKFKAEADASLDLKLKEKETTISALNKKIDDLKKRAEQGSQQMQGEVLELALEERLSTKFVYDEIIPVPKGVHGGDVIQRVRSPSGQICGSILWETKRTKAWSGSWIGKVKEDQRRAEAEVAVIMSSALPVEVQRFNQVEGVWVTDFDSALSLAEALRVQLISLANAKVIQEGQGTKMELIYEYLTGPKFKHRVEAIVEKFEDMRADLDKERKVMQRSWAKREAQIQGVIGSTIGMWGDLEGIAGKSMPEIDGLDIPLLESNDDI